MAFATESTVNELKLANCLTNDLIYIGQPLYVPRLPIPTLSQLSLVCAEFEDFKPGAAYGIGETFLTSGFSVTVDAFAVIDGTPITAGLAAVTSEQSTGSHGSQIQVDNVNLIFNLSTAPSQLSFLFGEYGGNLNIHVNSDFRNFVNSANLNSLLVSGTNVAVLKGYENDFGYLQLSGAIKSFAVGGQELWIDNVCFST